MPELPEVEVLARHLDDALRGKIIREVSVHRAKSIRPTSARSMRGKGADDKLFTAFDREWCLQVAPAIESSTLTRLGELVDVAADHPDVVKRLHAAALAEIRRRGLDPALADWLEGGAVGDCPPDCSFWDGWPDDSGHYAYFARLYQGD